MKLCEIAKKYYIDQNLNCACSMFLAVNEMYNLGLTKEDVQIVTAFGGGMGCGKICGAVTGTVSILGKLILKEGEMSSPKLKETVNNFLKYFEEETSSLNCSKLTPIYKKDNGTRCLETVEIACKALEKSLL